MLRAFVNASVAFGDISEWVDEYGKPSGASGYVASAANALLAARQMQDNGGCDYEYVEMIRDQHEQSPPAPRKTDDSFAPASIDNARPHCDVRGNILNAHDGLLFRHAAGGLSVQIR
jgi:hypothetical protein